MGEHEAPGSSEATEGAGPQTGPIRVVLVDDHPMWRGAVRADLEAARVATVVGEASDGGEAVDLARAVHPQVVLMDLNLPTMGGVEATRRIIEHWPDVKVLVLSASGEEADVLEAVKAGASGYILKSATGADLADAVDRVCRGEPVFTPSLAGLVLAELRRMASNAPTIQVLPTREQDILRLVAKGYSYGEIANRLSLASADVRHHMQNVLTRLQLRHEDALLDLVEEYGSVSGGESERVLATVLFTDIVSSTEHATLLGDRGWREMLETHHTLVRRELGRHRGREIDTAGDGFLAAFDTPAQAVRCAEAVMRSVTRLGIQIRAGIHTGECERIGDKLGGIAVHFGARIAAAAGPGEILVSSTVRDLVSGSGIRFVDAGARVLKGIPGRRRLFALEQGPGAEAPG